MLYLILTIIICITYILYVYVKYNKDAIPSERYDLYREKLDILPAEAGYLINKDCENADLILSDILTLVNEDYIKMELIVDDYVFSKTEKTDFTNLKAHQVLAYKLCFQDREQITLQEFLKDIRYDQERKEEAEVKYYSIKVLLDSELEKMGITDTNARKAMQKINSFSLKLIFIIPIIFFLNIFYEAIVSKNGIVSGILYIIEVFLIVLYMTTNSDEDKLTTWGANLREKALGFKHFLEENTIMEDKPFYMINILEYNYTTAIAMGLADMANTKFSKKYIQSIKKVKRNRRHYRKEDVIVNIIVTIIKLITVILVMGLSFIIERVM